MGLYADAELIWGIPVLAWDEETDEATPFWDSEREDWRKFEGELEVRPYGHYEDPDNQRGILTSTRVKPFRGNCWDPTRIGKWDFNVEDYQPADVDGFVDAVVAADLEEYLGEQGWWLVASYG